MQLILGVGCVVAQAIGTAMRDTFVAEMSRVEKTFPEYYRLFYTYETHTVDHAATGIWMGLFVSYLLLRGDTV